MRAKKSLGQNFLTSHAVAVKIVSAAELTQKDTVLEIGPGKGFLTRELLASGASVIAVEKDDRMIPLLQETFAQDLAEKRFTLIHGDIVELLENNTLDVPPSYKVVANIPYYITGFLLRAFLESKKKPSQMVLMVQKEVADRIVARPSARGARAGDKKESILSIATKAYGVPRIVAKVPARYFNPAPNVDSAVLSIESIKDPFSTGAQAEWFFELVKTGFAHKRKKLSSNLSELLGRKTEALLQEAGIETGVRAEDLPLEKWLALAKVSLSHTSRIAK